MSNRTKGLILAAIAAISYGLNPLFALPMYADGMSVESVLFCRYLLSAALIGVIMLLKKESFTLKSKEIIPLLIMGTFLTFASYFLFLSYNHMDVGIASSLRFVYPVLVAVINALFFKERVSFITIFSIALCCFGIAFLYRGEGGITLNTLGVMFVFISSLSYALYIVGVNRPSAKNISALKLTFYALLLGSVFFAAKLNLLAELQLPSNLPTWLNTVGISIFSTVISFVALSMAVHYIGSTSTSILGTLEPITAVFIGVAIFSENLTVRICIGIVLIIFAVSLIVLKKPILNSIQTYKNRKNESVNNAN